MLFPTVAAIVVAAVALAIRTQPTAQSSRASAGASATVRSGHVTVKISNYAYLPNLTILLSNGLANCSSLTHGAAKAPGGPELRAEKSPN